MANEERKVLLRVEIENTDLVKRSAEIRTELDKLKKKNKEINDELKTTDFGTKKYQQLQQEIVKNTAATNAYKKELASTNKEIDTNIKLLNSADGSNEQLRASLSLLTAEYNKLSEEERENTSKGKELQQTIKAISDELKNNESAVGDNRRNVGNYEESLKKVLQTLNLENVAIEKNIQQLEQQRNKIGFNTQITKEQKDELNGIVNSLNVQNQKYKENSDIIKQVTNSMGFLKDKIDQGGNVNLGYANTVEGMKQKIKDLQTQMETTDIGSKKFRELQEEIDETNLKIGQAAGKIDELGRKEPKNKIKKNMDDTAEAVGALSQSVGLLTVAFSNNENVAKFQEKALKAIAITSTIANVAKARFAILDTIQLVKTKALTLAQNLYTLAIGRSTGAARVFKVALAGTGIGAIVLLLGELIFNFDKVSLYIKRAVSWVRNFADDVSGGNKVVKALVEVLLLIISPLVTIIRLISDFSGTITEFQTAINGAYDWLIKITEGIPILGDAVKFAKAQFNFITDAIKSLDSGAKKFKPNIEGLTKVYEKHTAALDRANKKMEDQVKLMQAQGKSEQQTAEITRQSRKLMVQGYEESYKKAVEISNKLIKQNGKLNDEQQALFDKVQDDFHNAQLEQAVFEAEQIKAARDRAKERLQVERDLTAEINSIRNSLIKNDFERNEAELKEQFRVDKLAIEQELKRHDISEKAKQQLNEKLGLLEQKLNQELHEVDQERLKQVQENQKENAKFLEETLKASKAFKIKMLKDQYQEDIKFLDATFVSTAKNAQQRKEEERKLAVAKLEISKKYYEDALEIAKQFAAEDGKFTEDELNNLQAISQVISDINTQITELNDTKNILGLTAKEMDNLVAGANSFLQAISIISDVVNADFENRKRLIDDAINAEIEGVEKTKASQAQKEKQIKALEKKRGEEQYKIQVAQFEFQQSTASIQAIIQGALAFITALTSGVPPFNFINAGLVAASTAVQVGIIASQKPPAKPKFFDGGFTEQSGNPYVVSRYSNDERDVHHNEYITPWKVLKNPASWPYVSALESMRLSTPGSLSLKGFADGGLNSRSMGTSVTDMNQMIKVISSEVARNLSLVQIDVSVNEIDRVKKEMGKAQAKAKA